MKVEYNGSYVKAEMNEPYDADDAKCNSLLKQFPGKYGHIGLCLGIGSFVAAVFSLMSGVAFCYGNAYLCGLFGNDTNYYLLASIVACTVIVAVAMASGILGIVYSSKTKQLAGKLGLTFSIMGLVFCLASIAFDVILLTL